MEQSKNEKCRHCAYAREHGSISPEERSDEVVFCGFYAQFRAANFYRHCESFKDVFLTAHERGVVA